MACLRSFGEDEQGELYVADLNGSVNKIAPACPVTILPSSASFPQPGGTGNVTVTAPDGCEWEAESNSEWIVITGGTSGNGSGTVTYTVAPYAGPRRNRRGTISIDTSTLTVSQSK